MKNRKSKGKFKRNPVCGWLGSAEVTLPLGSVQTSLALGNAVCDRLTDIAPWHPVNVTRSRFPLFPFLFYPKIKSKTF